MIQLWQYNDSYLAHYGVKGMKWGVRKKNPISAWKGRRQTANAHNKAIKDEWNRQKSLQKSGKVSKSDASYRKARDARIQNLAGRALVRSAGYGKSEQGRYYQHRQNGKSVVEAGLRTYGHLAAKSIGGGIALSIGRTMVTNYLRSKR